MNIVQGLIFRFNCIVRVIRITGFRCWRRAHLIAPFPFVVAGDLFKLHAPNNEESRSVFCEVIVDDCYGLRGLFPPESAPLIVDIGANIGAFSSYARSLYPHSTVHSFDPHPKVLPHLQQNSSTFGFTVHPVGVSNREYVATLDSTTPATCSALDATTGFKVSVIHSQSVCPDQTIDLLKIDCEGAEHEIFEDQELLRRVRAIRMEYHADTVSKNDQLRATLRESGFTIIFDSPHAGCNGLIGVLFATRI